MDVTVTGLRCNYDKGGRGVKNDIQFSVSSTKQAQGDEDP